MQATFGPSPHLVVFTGAALFLLVIAQLSLCLFPPMKRDIAVF
jgi:hypothetical protein